MSLFNNQPTLTIKLISLSMVIFNITLTNNVIAYTQPSKIDLQYSYQADLNSYNNAQQNQREATTQLNDAKQEFKIAKKNLYRAQTKLARKKSITNKARLILQKDQALLNQQQWRSN